jgi:hypothetical protein
MFKPITIPPVRTPNADQLAALLDEVSHAVNLGGRQPQTMQTAQALLAYAESLLLGSPSMTLLRVLERRGIDPGEAQTIARALSGAAMQLGVWLGRNQE